MIHLCIKVNQWTGHPINVTEIQADCKDVLYLFLVNTEEQLQKSSISSSVPAWGLQMWSVHKILPAAHAL